MNEGHSGRLIEEYERQRATLRRAGRMAKIGGWELDLTTMKAHWSPEVYRIHELSEDHVLALEQAIEFYTPEVRPEVRQAVECCLTTGESWDQEWPFLTAKGKRRWVRAQGEAERDDTGKIRTLHGTLQDITERKEAEIELEEAQQLLRSLHQLTADTSLSHEDRVRRLLELGLSAWGLDLAIVSEIVDDEYIVLCAATGEGDPPPPGTKFELGVTYCCHVVKADAPMCLNNAGASEIAQHPCYETFHLESYIGAPLYVEGQRFGTLNFSSPRVRQPFSPRALELIALLSQWVGNEITQQRAKERLALAKEEAVRASAAKSEFLAMMSHEIRTPMNGVLGTARLLSDTALNADQRALLEILHSSGDALMKIINDLLDFSKIEAGKLELSMEEFTLDRLLRDVVDLFSGQANQKSIELTLDAPKRERLPGVLWGDAGRIRQIVSNYVGNAVKFTEKGHVRVTYSVEQSSADEADVRVLVQDTGPGVSSQALARLFRPFEQVEGGAARKFGGTGLGLAISQRLAHLMGGRVGVESEPGKGTTFWFEVSLETDWRKTGRLHPETSLVDVERQPVDAKVLLVEDNAVNQKVALRMLESLGCSVDLAVNGAEAVELTDRVDYDLVFMDCHMPEKDGYEATREIREREHARSGDQLRIIALTASVVDKDRRKCSEAGMNGFISKPISIDELYGALSEKVRVSSVGSSDET